MSFDLSMLPWFYDLGEPWDKGSKNGYVIEGEWARGREGERARAGGSLTSFRVLYSSQRIR